MRCRRPTPTTSRNFATLTVTQTCVSPPGWGVNYTLSLFGPGAPVAYPLRTNNPPNSLFSYAGAVVTSVSVLSGGSSTSASALPLRIAGSLLIDLSASDFSPSTNLWDNRATTGPVSVTNGDFGVITEPGGRTDTPPSLTTLLNVTCVQFTFPSAQSLSTYSTPSAGYASATAFASMYNGNPFTTEVLIMPLEPNVLST